MGIGKRKIGGLLLSIGAAQVILAIMLAQNIYPGYHVTQYLSDLGVGVTAPIFNISLIILGAAFIASAYYIKESLNDTLFTTLQAVVGIFAAGVGLFPETTGEPHILCALISFSVGGALVLLSCRLVKRPINYLYGALGLLSLGALALSLSGHDLGLGVGGIERIIVYPLFVWGVSFGGYLTSK